MTGCGEAHRQANGVAVAVEVRAINNRYFKLAYKCGEGYGPLEGEVESVVRKHIRRGTVQVTLRVDRPRSADAYRIDPSVLANYRRQLADLDAAAQVPWESLLMLPGVVIENPTDAGVAETDWPLIRTTLTAAMEALDAMRRDEGRAMAGDLATNCRVIAAELDGVEARAPQVVSGYRDRLHERLKSLLDELGVTITPADLIKEVSVYAERSDISEEVVRLKSHLEQFDSIMSTDESSGRKLEFLTQEMFREANTVGSKANDVQIARHVIEIKAAIERIREMIQNVE
jgi:uncharacterized protein (TIGR00255 family)